MAEQTKKKLSKTAKWLIAIGVIVVVLACFLLIWFFGHSHPEFDEAKQSEFTIPGLSDGVVPQGLCYVEDEDIYLMSGYMNNGSKSRIYVVDGETKETVKYFTISGVSEEFENGHFCGVASSGNFVWLATDDHCFSFSLEEIMTVENGFTVEPISYFDTGTGADFCFSDDTYLYVGEFFRNNDTITDESHHYQISENEINKAIAFRYEIDQSAENGLKSTTPVDALSIPNLVQGLAITDSGKIVLSTSYGLPDSNIYTYENVYASSTTETFALSETESIPLYILSSANLESTLVAPCMSEGIDYVNGRVVILFESACDKYKLFTRNRVTEVFSVAME